MFELVTINGSNWRQAMEIEVRADQVAFVADHQPVALVILAKCHVRPGGQVWTPYLALDDGEPVGVVAVASDGELAHLGTSRSTIAGRDRGSGGCSRTPWSLPSAGTSRRSARWW